MPLTLVRHPEPIGGAGRCYGRTDLPVEPSRTALVVAAVADRLLRPDQTTPGARDVHRVVTSPLRRALGLARPLARALQVPLVEDERFFELDFGSWEGLPWDEVPRAGLDAWAADLLAYRGHGGESVADLADRVASGLRACGPDDVVVCHLGVIRAVLARGGHPQPWSVTVPFGGIVEVDHPSTTA